MPTYRAKPGKSQNFKIIYALKFVHENAHEGLNSTSVVAVGYGSGDEAVAKLGVVGPTRMDYPGTMGAVRAVARYVGQILADS